MSAPHIGIIGGGIAGATAALHFAELGLDVSIFERGPSLVDGPPICHLHAGGNLYREISQQQCVQLLQESIETVKLYRHTLNVRPTVIAVPKQDKGQPEDLLPRLEVIKQAYHQLVASDRSNQVLGDPDHYYQLYSKHDLERLAKQAVPKPDDISEASLDEWMIPFAKQVDLNTLKFPVVLVQEYGLSVFRLSATVNISLQQLPNCHVYTDTTVTGVNESCYSDGKTNSDIKTDADVKANVDGKGNADNKTKWNIHFQPSVSPTSGMGDHSRSVEVDYLINASGYQTGTVDDWIKAPRSRLVEFKAAYVSRWLEHDGMWPEVIFHGERGTPQGMAQLTPYPDGYFQLHGMTEDITLFSDGVAKSTAESSQPKLPAYLINKMIRGWDESQQIERTNKAIAHMAQFIPSFASATVGGKPLFGAQQVPGSDISLRAASVSFVGDNYARLEIVKASSAIEAAKQVEAELYNKGYLSASDSIARDPVSARLELRQVLSKAFQLAQQRHYPTALADIGGVNRDD
ncbi:NAD(P)-binding protein [Vibrio sp. S11_S32]|uniref:NAD(P)-binding protein n=1 Tax=Vibrio sp. S11_S32 TaxID=2720225 RepID=UPI00168100A0|nr:NAD(P)-binding protein [Vibrio sp. S11_S32]MBD1576510.1 NAD(P)-binding protein [Vibrio sp. S11_S32]